MLTLTEAAGRLGLDPSTLRHQIRNGKLRGRLIGKTWTITWRELERYRATSLGRRRPRAKLGRLTSFGYSGIRSADQLRTVLEGVRLVVDVRLSPASRLPLWGRATRDTITRAGPRYDWVGGLGNVNYKGGPIQIADIEAIETAVLEPLRAGLDVGLLCVCASAGNCHRRTVAEEAQRRLPGLVVRHL